MQRIISRSLIVAECALLLEQLRPQSFRNSLTATKVTCLKKAGVRLLAVAALLAACLFVAIGCRNALLPSGSHDMQWTPTRDLLAGVNPYENFINWQEDGHELTPPHFLNQSPSYPASVYVMIAPLGMLDWGTAKATWLTINLALIALMLAGLQKQFPIRHPWALTFLIAGFLCSTPVRASLGAGQINFLSLAAFVWAYHFSQTQDRRSQCVAGILLAIAWAKYSLTFPLTLVFINQRNWRPIALAALIHFVLTLAAALQLNLYPQEFFFNSVAVVMMGNGTGFANMAALAMLLHVPSPVAMSAISIALLGAAYSVARIKDIRQLPLLAVLAMLSYALFYHHSYDFIVLLFLAWCIVSEKLSASVLISSGTIIVLSWFGVWLAHELQLHGIISQGIVAAVEGLQVLSFYLALALLAFCLRASDTGNSIRTRGAGSGTTKVSNGMLAF